MEKSEKLKLLVDFLKETTEFKINQISIDYNDYSINVYSLSKDGTIDNSFHNPGLSTIGNWIGISSFITKDNNGYLYLNFY